MTQLDTWTNCYDMNWKNLITPAAFSLSLKQWNFRAFPFHMALVATPNQVRPDAGVGFSLKESGRNDMMNVKFSTKFTLCYATVKAFVILLLSHYLPDSIPSRAMWSPSTLPTGIVFASPVSRLPAAKALPITKELLLAALGFLLQVPFKNRFILAAKRTGYSCPFGSIGPSLRELIFGAARGRAKVILYIQEAIGLKRYGFAALGAINLDLPNTIFVSYLSGKPRPTMSIAKSTVLRGDFGEIRLQIKNSTTKSANRFYPFLFIHIPILSDEVLSNV